MKRNQMTQRDKALAYEECRAVAATRGFATVGEALATLPERSAGG
jgi:hypothetical protein